MESDSLNVVSALSNNTLYVSDMGDVFEECRSILRQRDDFKIQHVRRHANRVDHNIARISCLSGTVDYFSSPPSCVLEYILLDYPV